jgi:hypothetical protein
MTVNGTVPTFTLTPLSLPQFGAMPALTLSGVATEQSYSLHLSGTATAAELQSLREKMPALGDGLDAAIPELQVATVAPVAKDAKPVAEKPLKVNVTCTRTWPNAQVCVNAAPETSKPARRKR